MSRWAPAAFAATTGPMTVDVVLRQAAA